MPEYPIELDSDEEMSENVTALAAAVVGHRIVKVEQDVPFDTDGWSDTATVLTLDTGRRVALSDTSDCCAYTELESFVLHADKIDHIITGVGTTDNFETWHIYADMGDVLELTVGWSPGSGYYVYGFHLTVEDPADIHPDTDEDTA